MITLFLYMKLFYAKILAEELMHLHGLDDWKFCFDHAKKRFGCCNYTKKQISLSAELVSLNSENHVRDTILHEIAHALAGHRAGHGKIWKETVERIGGTPTRCYAGTVKTPLLAFTALCQQCGMQVQRRQKRNLICGKCRVRLQWKRN